MQSVTSKKAARALPALRADANKYTRGVCEIVAGSDRFVGAAVLAATAANRMGAGYVEVYSCAAVADVLHIVQPSIVAFSMRDYASRVHEQRSDRPRALVIGCGMAGADDEVGFVLDALERAAVPAVVDGGGLAALCTPRGAEIARRRFVEGLPTVITPHAGEAARLLAFLAEQPGAADLRRFDSAHEALVLARAYGATCVLKGPDTFIATGDEESPDEAFAMLQGTPALAKAGTGDILAGAIGSLLAQGASPLDACVAATFVHARAGMLASVDAVERCVTAEDVLDHLAPAVAALERKVRKEGN